MTPLNSVNRDWAIYGTLGKFLKPLATTNLPKSLTFLGYFCKGVKSYHFSSEISFGQLLLIFGDFFLVILYLGYGLVKSRLFKVANLHNFANLLILLTHIDKFWRRGHYKWPINGVFMFILSLSNYTIYSKCLIMEIDTSSHRCWDLNS